MNIAGIIVEYNPVHSGHAYQIARTREILGEDTAVLCCMSGNFVQSGQPALADKWLRARLAILAGADLVVELPTVWAASSAEHFAQGGVRILAAAGASHLVFGSESGDLEGLQALAQALDSPLFGEALRRYLGRGLPFARCRQLAAAELLGPARAALLENPNNNLAVEYLRAIRRLGVNLIPLSIRRRGAGYHQLGRGDFASATQIRRWIRAGNWTAAQPYLIPGEREALAGANLALAPGEAGAERMVLSALRTMERGDWTALPDSGAAEGLPERLIRAGRTARSLEEFYQEAKTKRYPRARLQRLVLWAFLGLREADRRDPPYLRILAAGNRGREVLRTMKKEGGLPVLTKPAHVNKLDPACRRSFALEARCTDLYGLCLSRIPEGGREWTSGPAILE